MSDLRQHLKHISSAFSVAEFPPALKYDSSAWCIAKGTVQLPLTAITAPTFVHCSVQSGGSLRHAQYKSHGEVPQSSLLGGHSPPYTVFQAVSDPSTVTMWGADTHGGVSKAGELTSLNFAFFSAPILRGSKLHFFTPKMGKSGGKN